MTPEDARKLLRRSVEDYNNEKASEAEVRFHVPFLAAVLEPEEIMAALPEPVRFMLVEYSVSPMRKYEDDRWRIWGGVSYREKKLTKEEDMEHYYGICRLHGFLNGRGRLCIKVTVYFPAHPSYFDNVYSQEEIDKALAECERLFGKIFHDFMGTFGPSIGTIELVLLREPGKDMGVVFRMSDSVFPAYLAPEERDKIIRYEKGWCECHFHNRKLDLVNIMERERGNYFGEIGHRFKGREAEGRDSFYGYRNDYIRAVGHHWTRVSGWLSPTVGEVGDADCDRAESD
jgi:hypothetical protein